ncbi:MAG: hypothetical protein RL662_1889 [Bacteroidota bacterium]
MKKIKYFLIFLIPLFTPYISAQKVSGYVYDDAGLPLPSATVVVEGTYLATMTDEHGAFVFDEIPSKNPSISVSFVGFEAATKQVKEVKSAVDSLTFKMIPSNQLCEIEVFGERHKQPEKLDAITRMPLRPSEQIQSISVISDKMIVEQGALTVTDAVRNVPGVTLFGSYGGVRESMSTRGYRGVPILKNGVRVDSDFRTASLASDMQGVESIQVIKGSAAVTQGVGNDLGSPGGVINVVTKTPRFVNAGEVSVRTGSWGQFRPTFDVQSVLDKKNNMAFRLNGAYERADSFRKGVSKNRVYINPSFEWRPDAKTTLTFEMDYLNDNTTPDPGTINLASDDIEALYEMPHDKFLGFENDNVNTKNLTYAVRFTRLLSDKLSVRAAYFNSSLNTDNTGASISRIKNETNENVRARSLARSLRDDKNTAFQLDLIGRDMYTGSVKHTFQVGFDYKTTNLMTNSYGYLDSKGKFVNPVIDTIDVLKPTINNVLKQPLASQWGLNTPVTSSSSSYGIMVQEVMSINRYAKAILGLRYSYGSSADGAGTGATTGDAWNPMVGLMLSPLRNVNLFGSYTTTTSLRTASNKMANGESIGASTSRQFEFGIKSDWLKDRLRFNFTYFDILNSNLSYTEYQENTNTPTGYYGKAGDLKRRGIETELSGRILSNLQVALGYAYLDAQYQNSPSYVNGSAPMNAPKHTANGWVYYNLAKGIGKGLAFGLGTYYVGKRPINEYQLIPDGHGTPAGVKPFDMPAYTTVNLQIAYNYQHFTARVFLNNLFDELGYNSYYRGGYINQIEPRNFAASVSYRF